MHTSMAFALRQGDINITMPDTETGGKDTEGSDVLSLFFRGRRCCGDTSLLCIIWQREEGPVRGPYAVDAAMQ